MSGYNTTPIPKPSDDVDFEQKCVHLFRQILNDPNAQRLGETGQSQDGVDIVGHRNRKAKTIVGVQCKLKEEGKKVTETEVRSHVKMALKYKPKLAEYIIVTTAKNNTKLQQLAQALSLEQTKKGRKIAIEVWGWGILQERINEYDSVREIFDPAYSPLAKKTKEQLELLSVGQSQQATKTQVAELKAKLEEVAGADRLPAHYADRELQQRLARGLRRRGFSEADWTKESARLARQVVAGQELSLASVALRAEVLRRAARANADTKTISEAKEFYAAFQAISSDEVDRIYVALMADAEGNSDRALQLLRDENNNDARSATFNILLRAKGAKQALDWIETQRLRISDFVPFGPINVLLKRIEVGQFDRALQEISQLTTEDFRRCPVLHLLKANLIVASLLPADQKGWAFQGLPMDARALRPAIDKDSRVKLKAARAEIGMVSVLADELQLTEIRGFLTELDLWLQLVDPDTAEHAKASISQDLTEPTKVLNRTRLALSFGIPLKVQLINQHLKERQKLGGWTDEERTAAFLLAYHSRDYSKLAAFFDEYRQELFAQEGLSRIVLALIEVEALARAKRFDDARQRWAEHKEKHISKDEAADVLEIIDSIERGDEAELLRKRYEESKQLADLRMLVQELVSKSEYRQLANYAPAFARQTGQVSDLRMASQSLYHEGQYSELLDLLEPFTDAIEQDNEIKSLRAWSLFNLGRVMEARALARQLFEQRHDANDRELAINTAVESGDWGYLPRILAEEMKRSESHDAATLIRLARLAFEAGSSYADQFRDAALRRFPKSPEVYLAAYVLEVERGNEQQSARSGEWFQKAAKLSGKKGPVQSVGMKELIAKAPAWNQQVEKVETSLRLGQIPIFVAAQGLRRQPIDMFLGQAFRNASVDQPRVQAPILAYSGARPLVDLSGISRVALDISAILTLGYLGLLRETIEAFDSVVIAPTTLSTIFTERQFLRVHQPSEQAKAERLRQLLSAGQLHVIPDEPATPQTCSDIDSDLLDLLKFAKQKKGVVVRSAPVHRVGSFMDETVEMSEFGPVLADTHAILKFLIASGKIDTKVKTDAAAYLKFVDKGWSYGRAINADTRLYLDELTVTYLDHVQLLEPLTRSVAAVYIEKSVAERADAVVRYGTLANKTVTDLERICTTLNAGIELGAIRLSARRDRSARRGRVREDISAPSLELMADLSKTDLVVADDRFMNKDAVWTDGTRRIPTVSSYSIVRALNARGKISQAKMWRARHELRVAGYCVVPIETDELLSYINSATVTERGMVETPELRAIRESLSLPKRANVYLVSDMPWLVAARLMMLQAIRAVWASRASPIEAAARADWLLYTMPDPLVWCVDPADGSQWGLASNQGAAQIALLLCFFDGKVVRRRQYAEWIDSRLVRRMSVNQSWLLDQAIEFLKTFLARLLEGVK